MIKWLWDFRKWNSQSHFIMLLISKILIPSEIIGNIDKLTTSSCWYQCDRRRSRHCHIYQYIINNVDSLKTSSHSVTNRKCFKLLIVVRCMMPYWVWVFRYQERYVSRVRATQPSSDKNNIDKAEGMKPTWMVEAKSIRSSSFDSLKSRRLR